MPLYMDIHRGMEDATAEGVREAHVSDLEAQEKHGVRYLKYWFDEERGTVCCLVEAPNPQACAAVHGEAHGGIADEIIEVEMDLIGSFLGGGKEDAVGCGLRQNGDLDPAFRTIMFTDIVGSTAMSETLGDEEVVRLLKVHDDLLSQQVGKHFGRRVKHTGDGMLLSFVDVSRALDCAMGIQQAFAAYRAAHPDDHPLHVRVGLSAGEPVARSQDLYGAAVNLAARVCDQAYGGEVVVAKVVRDLCIGKSFSFDDRGPVSLKGFSEPQHLYCLPWEAGDAKDAG
jgi:class 3 adenylate cyclase